MLIVECRGPMVMVRSPEPSNNRDAEVTRAVTVAVRPRTPIPENSNWVGLVMAGVICRFPRP